MKEHIDSFQREILFSRKEIKIKNSLIFNLLETRTGGTQTSPKIAKDAKKLSKIYTVKETENKPTQIRETKKDKKARMLKVNGDINKYEAKQSKEADKNIKNTITNHEKGKKKTFQGKISY